MAPTPGRGLAGNMRKLHLVGFSAEHAGFILATKQGAKSGSYLLPLDDSLIRAIEGTRAGDPRRQGPASPARSGVQSGLTPREIQARLRSGRTIEEVAAEAGVTVDWVERFAAPVLAEQAAAVDRAGRAVLHTPRKGPSDRPLEASVRRNLADRGVVMGNDDWQEAWSARHLVDTDWLVSFGFRSRGRPVTAEWVLNTANGALAPRNRLGTELGYVDPDRRVEAAAVAAGGAPAGKAVAPAKPAVPRAAVPKPAVPKPAVAKTPAKKAPTAKAAAEKAAPAGGAAVKATPGKAAAKKAAVLRKATPTRPAAATPARPGREVASTPVEPAPTDTSRRLAGEAAAVTRPLPPRVAAAPAGAHFARPANRTRPVAPEPTTTVPAPNGQQAHRLEHPRRANRPAAPPAEPPPRLFDTDDVSPDDGGIRHGSRD